MQTDGIYECNLDALMVQKRRGVQVQEAYEVDFAVLSMLGYPVWVAVLVNAVEVDKEDGVFALGTPRQPWRSLPPVPWRSFSNSEELRVLLLSSSFLLLSSLAFLGVVHTPKTPYSVLMRWRFATDKLLPRYGGKVCHR
ncbi:hypothetical protein LXL04_036385 [Taraxacum kok-saghyz]